MPAAVAAAFADPARARAAASQDWPPFVLVAGLLLIGLVADDDGLFAAVGNRLARVFPNEVAMFAGCAVVVAIVTAVLNLDTSVAFLTPVFVHLARSRRSDEAPLLYGCLILSNTSSLLLPGSNLTNLIVLGHLHLSGGHFAARMLAPFALSVLVSATVVGVLHRRELSTRFAGHEGRRPRQLANERTVELAHAASDPPAPPAPGWLGASAVVSATVLVVGLRSPAVPVAAVGAATIVVQLARRRDEVAHVSRALGAHLLLGLFGIAIALGVIGRSWSGPAVMLNHLDSWSTGAVAALFAVVLNNLPAASLLSARVPPHPFAMLVGLNLGPNLMVTGSLSSLLWYSAARSAGATPSVRRVSRIGLAVVPLSMVAALGMLAITNTR